MGFIGSWINKNNLDSKKLVEVIRNNPKLGQSLLDKFNRKGVTLKDFITIVREIYKVEPIMFEGGLLSEMDKILDESLKKAIDDGNVVLSFVRIQVKEPDPNDSTKIITKTYGHAVAIVGYDKDGKMIYFDPSKGYFRVTDSGDFDNGFRVILKDKR